MTYQYAIDYAPWEFNLPISYNHSKKKVTIIKPRGNITSNTQSIYPQCVSISHMQNVHLNEIMLYNNVNPLHLSYYLGTGNV